MTKGSEGNYPRAKADLKGPVVSLPKGKFPEDL